MPLRIGRKWGTCCDSDLLAAEVGWSRLHLLATMSPPWCYRARPGTNRPYTRQVVDIAV